MGDATAKLLAMCGEADPFAHPQDEVVPLQVEAIAERFQTGRCHIPLLAQRAGDIGVESITDLPDVVPLLFSHTTYKSYPDSFVAQGRWDMMCRWLRTLSSFPLDGVDVSGVRTVDEWLQRLWDAGHHVFSSSGTTGKCSFLDQTASDRETSTDGFIVNLRCMQGVAAEQDRPVFLLTPRRGAHRFVDVLGGFSRAFGRPDAVYWLSDQPATAAEINRLGMLQHAMGQGRATPQEIADLKRFASERQERMRGDITALLKAILRHRGEPAIFIGLWAQYWMIMEAARSQGIPDGGFHPDTVLFAGGGLKGAQLPADHQDQIRRFFGLDVSRVHQAYGMVEMSTMLPGCAAGRYHRPPWIVPLILDRPGEHLLNAPSGEVTGRMAFFDVTLEGRWGGLISGDQVTADFSACPCGRPGPTIAHIVRYTDLPEGDDKLTCAGTMDAYIKGLIDA